MQEIGRQVQGSAALAQRAMGEADQTAHLVQELNGAVARIGDVVGLISNIASQTNLLALIHANQPDPQLVGTALIDGPATTGSIRQMRWCGAASWCR